MTMFTDIQHTLRDISLKMKIGTFEDQNIVMSSKRMFIFSIYNEQSKSKRWVNYKLNRFGFGLAAREHSIFCHICALTEWRVPRWRYTGCCDIYVKQNVVFKQFID